MLCKIVFPDPKRVASSIAEHWKSLAHVEWQERPACESMIVSPHLIDEEADLPSQYRLQSNIVTR